jgi:F420-non-reducing hydrogenase iron-sulfur subunit
MGVEGFEPRIIAFMCNWCTYAGADNAGVARLESPANILPIRVMCSGRISPEAVMRAFRAGADGVLVMGCHIGDCHYAAGNHRTIKRMPLLRNLLSYVGVNPERMELVWVSAAEAPRFVQVTKAFTQKIKEMGPLAEEMKE